MAKSKPTFEKRLPDNPRKVSGKGDEFEYYFVVRHTRAGDKIESKWKEKHIAMDTAERIADHAAYYYGHGSTSVFKGRIVLDSDAIPGE